MVKQWVKSNILDIIQVAAIVGAAVTGIFVWLQNVPWYLVILGVLFAIFLVITSVNQYDNWKERHKKGFLNLSNENMGDLIRKWFDKRHYSTSMKTDDKVLFRIVGIDPQERSLNVFKPKENPSVICIRLAIN